MRKTGIGCRTVTGRELISLALDAATAVAKRAECALAYLDPNRMIKCRPGCSLCCRLEVAARPFEVIAIAAFIRSNISGEKFQQVRSRIKSTAKRYSSVDEKHGKYPFVPCPLLENDYCMAYPIRPSTCIVHTSFDYSDCNLIHAKLPVKSNPFFQSTVWSYADMRELLFRNETETSPDWLVFVTALNAIVDDPERHVEKWIAGEDIFLSTRVRGEDV